MVDKEVVPKAAVRLLHPQEPGHCHGEEQENHRDWQQGRDQPVALAHQDPRQQDRARQHEADQSLGEDAKRGKKVGQSQRRAVGQASVQAQHGACTADDAGRNHSGDQHVEIGILGAGKEHRLGHQHDDRQGRQALVRIVFHEQVQGACGDQGAEDRCHASSPVVGAEHLQRQARQPVK